jgi:5-(carboxyamino)imidazole ribonucleotide synthase
MLGAGEGRGRRARGGEGGGGGGGRIRLARVTYPVVGMVGGGQLARMTAQAAVPLGIRFRVLAESPTASAAQVAADVEVGDHRDEQAVLRFAKGCDVVTFDHEHVPTELLHRLADAGVAVRPGPEALVHAQDKQVMRERLTAAGVPSPRWRAVDGLPDVAELAATAGWPVVLKATRGGYDGRGVWVARDEEQAADILAKTSAPVLAEERVEFARELAVLVARSPHGQAAAYPVVETVQRDGICREVVAPAPGIAADHALAAQRAALRVAQELDVTGVMAVEMFDTSAGVLVNELAMRPHNSGHWTIDGAVTSQFEQHLRAVLDLPLGDPRAHAAYAVMVNVLCGEQPDLYPAFRHCQARDPGLRIHVYGKEVRKGRKVAHVTVIGADLDDLRERARHAAAYLSGEARP